jgi:hypothetical protein
MAISCERPIAAMVDGGSMSCPQGGGRDGGHVDRVIPGDVAGRLATVRWITQLGGAEWRATADEDGHYCFAVAL